MTDELKPSPEAVRPDYEARQVAGGVPTNCCDYGVVSLSKGKEICRVWDADDAKVIADLLNARAIRPATVPGDVVERLKQVHRYCSPLQGGVDKKLVDDTIVTLTAMQPAIQAAVDALEPVGNMEMWTESAADSEMVLMTVGTVRKMRSTLATLRTVTEQEEGCAHAWEYQGYDRAGSHKGEDRYKCCKCKKIEYRHD